MYFFFYVLKCDILKLLYHVRSQRSRILLSLRFVIERYALCRDILKCLFPRRFRTTLVAECSAIDGCARVRILFARRVSVPQERDGISRQSGPEQQQQPLNGPHVLNIKIDFVRLADLFIRVHVRDAHTPDKTGVFPSYFSSVDRRRTSTCTLHESGLKIENSATAP